MSQIIVLQIFPTRACLLAIRAQIIRGHRGRVHEVDDGRRRGALLGWAAGTEVRMVKFQRIRTGRTKTGWLSDTAFYTDRDT